MAESDTATEPVKWERDKGLNLYGRLHAVMQEVGFLDKDKAVKGKGGGDMYSYISHDSVTAAVRVGFIKHGIVVLPTITKRQDNGNRAELDVRVTLVNVDEPDDRACIDVVGYGVDSSDKGPGKAFSYAVKYAYMKLLMLNSMDDIEGSDIKHDPDSKRESQVEKSEATARDALKVAATNLRTAIEGAKTVAEVDALQKANKSWLMDAPEPTRDYFIEKIEARKQALEAA